MPATPAKDPHRPVREYGCVLCQKYHREGLDAEYEPHIYSQSKHGIGERRPEVSEVFERLIRECGE